MAKKYDLDNDPDYIAHMELANHIGDLEWEAICYRDEAKHYKNKGNECRYKECIEYAQGYDHQVQELKDANPIN